MRPPGAGEAAVTEGAETAKPKTSRAVTYREALRALDTSRAHVLAGFKARGGDRERWQALDRRAMAEAISRAEDGLELDHPGRVRERSAMKDVRRRLELSVRDR